MMMRDYIEIFDEIFWEVADELNLSAWYELFDSEQFDEVEKRVAKTFEEADASDVPFFTEWYTELAQDL